MMREKTPLRRGIYAGDETKDIAYAYLYLASDEASFVNAVLHKLDQKIIYPHYDFKHLTEKYFEIGMKLDDFPIQLVKYCNGTVLRVDGGLVL